MKDGMTTPWGNRPHIEISTPSGWVVATIERNDEDYQEIGVSFVDFEGRQRDLAIIGEGGHVNEKGDILAGDRDLHVYAYAGGEDPVMSCTSIIDGTATLDGKGHRAPDASKEYWIDTAMPSAESPDIEGFVANLSNSLLAADPVAYAELKKHPYKAEIVQGYVPKVWNVTQSDESQWFFDDASISQIGSTIMQHALDKFVNHRETSWSKEQNLNR